jgi:L1 cell adhesion molecule like protein
LQGHGERNVLIFYLGCRTFDVSILTIENGKYKIKATAGDNHLGCEDFDNRMVIYFLERFKRKYKKDLTTDMRAVGRLRAACERAKCALSCLSEVNIRLHSLFEGISINKSIARTKFEEWNKELFNTIMRHVKNSLRDAKMGKAQIHDIVLIGGSTQIPMVQKLLQDFFKDKKLIKLIKPDEAVAYGAAVQAAILAGVGKSEEVQDLHSTDVTPMSLGIGTNAGAMDVFIKRNTPIPTKKTKIYNVPSNNMEPIMIAVYEGEQAMTKDNRFLGYLELKISLPLRRMLQFEVTFDIDANGILNVTAVDKITGKENKITINNYKRQVSKAELQLKAKGAEKYRPEDEKNKRTIAAQIALQAYCYKMCSSVEDVELKGRISESDKHTILVKCNEVIRWMAANKSADKEEYVCQQKQLESVCNSIMNKGY